MIPSDPHPPLLDDPHEIALGSAVREQALIDAWMIADGESSTARIANDIWRAFEATRQARARGLGAFPPIVCLCGSTRFKDAFTKAQLDETLAGKIVLTIGCNMRSDAEIFGAMSDDERARVKARLDRLHLHKIALASEILILNVGGYIGESTPRELAYAYLLQRPVRFLEDIGIYHPANLQHRLNESTRGLLQFLMDEAPDGRLWSHPQAGGR